jgi:hypothetical protein
MCSQCDETDVKIKRLQVIARRILDQQTFDGIADLVKALEAEKGCPSPGVRPPKTGSRRGPVKATRIPTADANQQPCSRIGPRSRYVFIGGGYWPKQATRQIEQATDANNAPKLETMLECAAAEPSR